MHPLVSPSLRAAAVLALAAGCSRDFTLPSAQERLALSPAFSAVAPRETLALAATGGAGGYTYLFAEGGKLSGASASVDGASGAYQAGERGSAQDVVEVVDRAGTRASARVSVGPRLVLSPAIASIAPRGKVTFSASGGKPPYAFKVNQQALAASNPAGDQVEYQAPAGLSDAVLALTVSDATGDPQAVATATIAVGSRLRLLPQRPAVAPLESVDFVAVGGQSPYTWSVQPLAGEPAMSPTSTLSETGRYVAGGGGPRDVLDQVKVTDANGNQDTTLVTVGAALQLSLAATDLRPGVPAQLVAAGGKPPYRYAFAPRGNRSGGTVDAVSGLYTPGPSYLATDLIEASDATGRAGARLAKPLPVGPAQLAVGPGVRRCFAADLDGDRAGDAVFLASKGRLVAGLRLGSAAPQLDSYALAWDDELFPPAFPLALDGDHLADLAFVGGTGLASGTWGAWAFLSQLGGRLSPGPTLSPLARIGAAARWPQGPGVSFLTDALCSLGAGAANDGLQRLDWDPAAGWSLGACMALPYASASLPAAALATADWDADGFPDVVWLLRYPVNGLMIAWGTAGGGFEGRPHAVPANGATYVELRKLPESFAYTFNSQGDGAQDRMLTVDEGVLLRLGVGNPQRNWAVLYDPVNARLTQVDPAAAADPTIQGFARFWPAPGVEERFLSWNGASGRLSSFLVDDVARAVVPASRPLAADLPFGVGCVATPDVNGDGLSDLVAAGEGSSYAVVVAGEGDGRFGARPRWSGVGAPLAGADLDHDGVGDLVVSQDGLVVLYGGEGQLARGQRVTGASARVVAAPQLCSTDGKRAILYQDAGGSFWSVRDEGTGSFGAPRVFAVPTAANAAYTWPLDALVPGLFNVHSSSYTTCQELIASRVDLLGRSNASVLVTYGPDGASEFPFNVLPPFGEPVARACTYLPVGRADGSNGDAVAGACVVQDAGLPGTPYTKVALWGATRSGTAWPIWAPIGSKPGTNLLVPEAAVAGAGTLGNGRPVFVAGLDGALWTAVVTAPDPGVPTGWSVTWTALPAAGLLRPEAALLGDLRGGGARRDLVVTGQALALVPGGTVVLTGDGAGAFTFLQRLAAAAAPALAAPLTKDGPADVVGLSGAGAKAGLAPELVLLRNLGDGTGRVD